MCNTKTDFCSLKSHTTLDLFPIDDRKLEKINNTKELAKFLKNKNKLNVKQDYLYLNKPIIGKNNNKQLFRLMTFFL